MLFRSNLRFVDEHRQALHQQYPDFNEFREHFAVPQDLVDRIVAEGKRQDIKPKDDAELQTTLPYLRTQLKALIARDLWNMDEYFAIMNELNDSVRRALELIKN